MGGLPLSVSQKAVSEECAGLTVHLQAADTKYSVRQGTSDPRQGN